MNTDFIARTAKHVQKNPGQAAFRGLSAAAIVWLYATFPTQRALDKVESGLQKQVDELTRQNEVQWSVISGRRSVGSAAPVMFKHSTTQTNQ